MLKAFENKILRRVLERKKEREKERERERERERIGTGETFTMSKLIVCTVHLIV